MQLFNEDCIRAAQQVAVLFLHFTQHAHAQTRPRERVAVQHIVRQTQFEANLTHFIFEQLAQRFNEAHLHLFRQAAHVVVRFDDVRFTGCGSSGLDDVRVDGPLRQPFHVFQLQRFFVKHFNEHATDDFTLRFRIVFARQRSQETRLAFDVNDVQAEAIAKHIHNLLGFIQTQQPVIHKDAGQVFADGAVQQHGGDGGIHAAGQAEDHLIVANLLTNALNSIVDNFGRGPQRFTLADIAYETLQHAQTLTGMGDFRVELYAVEALLFVSHNGERAGFGAGNGDEVRRDGGDFVAVAHPDVQHRLTVRAQRIFDTVNQGAIGLHFNLRIAKLTFIRGFNVAAQLHRHGLHAVAYAEYRHAGFKDILRRARAVIFGGAFRAAGKNNAVRIKLTNLSFSHVPCPQFTVDT